MVNGLHVSVDYQIERDFRQAVGKKLGAKKGALKEAIEEAMKMWIANNKVD